MAKEDASGFLALRRHGFFWVGLLAYACSWLALVVPFALGLAFPSRPPPPALSVIALYAMVVSIPAAPVTFAWGLWTGGHVHGAISWSAVIVGPAGFLWWFVEFLLESGG